MYFDINNVQLQIGDVIYYDDVEHNLTHSMGVIRKNLIDVFEVVNVDLQSGNDLSKITNILLWQ